MQKIVTLRFALPAVVILTAIAIAMIVLALVAHAHTGAAYTLPCC